MSTKRISPGPIADETFTLGLQVSTLVGLVVVGFLYWSGVLSVTSAGHVIVTVALFPVYVLTAACLLAAWLGYQPDESDMRRIEREAVTAEEDEDADPTE
jgi:hypothetical protein